MHNIIVESHFYWGYMHCSIRLINQFAILCHLLAIHLTINDLTSPQHIVSCHLHKYKLLNDISIIVQLFCSFRWALEVVQYLPRICLRVNKITIWILEGVYSAHIYALGPHEFWRHILQLSRSVGTCCY